MAERGLRDVELIGGLGDSAVFMDRLDRTQVAEFNMHYQRSSCCSLDI